MKFEDLEAWQEARSVVRRVYGLTGNESLKRAQIAGEHEMVRLSCRGCVCVWGGGSVRVCYGCVCMDSDDGGVNGEWDVARQVSQSTNTATSHKSQGNWL